MSRPVLCITHPQALTGRSSRRWREFGAQAAARALRLQTVLTEWPGHAIELARHCPPDTTAVVAVGGDGTANEVATGLLLEQREIPLSFLALGTGNDLATQLGLRTVADTVAALAGARVRRIDAIRVSHDQGMRFALVFAAAGFAGELLRQTTPRSKRLLGPRFSYWAGFFRAVASYQPAQMQVTSEGRSWAQPLFHVCAGNAEYAGGGGMRLSPGARYDDGEIDLCVIEAMNRSEILREFPRLIRGTHPAHPKVAYFRGRSLTVEAEAPMAVGVDGDSFRTRCARFEVVPAALPVLVPPDSGHGLAG